MPFSKISFKSLSPLQQAWNGLKNTQTAAQKPETGNPMKTMANAQIKAQMTFMIETERRTERKNASKHKNLNQNVLARFQVGVILVENRFSRFQST
jgi:hypothetical protein